MSVKPGDQRSLQQLLHGPRLTELVNEFKGVRSQTTLPKAPLGNNRFLSSTVKPDPPKNLQLRPLKNSPAGGSQLEYPDTEHLTFLLLPDVLCSGPGKEQERKGKMVQVPSVL